MDKETIRNNIDAMLDDRPDDITDGIHTFGSLYYQRCALFAFIVNEHPDLAYKTRRHEDGEQCFGGGWFLVAIHTPEGDYGYHYADEFWDMFHCPELPKSPHWDGYTDADVGRLYSLLRN